MENPKNSHSRNKQEKHQMAIRVGGGGSGGGGGGVGGVVVWGGIVAVATLVSVSAIRLTRKRPTNKSRHHPPPAVPSADLSNELELNNNNNSNINDDQGKGLRVLLQDYSPPMDYHPSIDGTADMSVTQIDSTSLAFTESSILDDNPGLDFGVQNKNPTYLEILLSDNSKPKNSQLITDYGAVVQGNSLPVLNGPSFLEPGKTNKNEPTGDTLDVEFIAEGKTNEEEDNPPAGLIRKGGEAEEHDGEKIEEIGVEVIETAWMNRIAVEGDSEVTEAMREDKAVQINTKDSRGVQSVETIMEKGQEAIETAEKDLFEVEVIKIVKEEAANEATDEVQIEAEDNQEMHLIEEEQEYDDGGNAAEKDEAIEVVAVENEPQVTLMSEDEEDDEDDDEFDDDEIDVEEDEEEIVEKGEESSDRTGDSSMESNAEAIWPAESIQELSLEFKELKIINKTLQNKIDDTEEHGCYNSNIYVNVKELLARIKLSTDSSNLRIWIWPSSVLLMLLLLAVPLLFSPADIVKLCLIVFMVVILFQV